VVLVELEERRVGSDLGHRSSSLKDFSLPPIHPPPPLLVTLSGSSQVIQGNVELDQVQVQDRDEEAYEDEAVKDEEEMIRVQREIKRLRQEQKSIMRRKAAAQCLEARRQHTNRERAKLAEL
jgi:hypothetical protein